MYPQGLTKADFGFRDGDIWLSVCQCVSQFTNLVQTEISTTTKSTAMKYCRSIHSPQRDDFGDHLISPRVPQRGRHFCFVLISINVVTVSMLAD